MAAAKKTNASKAPKGSKAACEAAGWKFAPLASIFSDERGQRHRAEGGRGTMAIPPAGSGIEPRQFGGSLRAVAWAVEHLGQVAKQPDDAPAGMAGVHLLLSAALASGEVCGGGNETPEQPDGKLLALCAEALRAGSLKNTIRKDGFRLHGQHIGKVDSPTHKAFDAAIKGEKLALVDLASLHATTREGLLQKARATLLVFENISVPGAVRSDTVRTLIEDLIHLVPTLIDARGQSIVPPDADAENMV